MRKRGQVTLFMIIGMVLLLLLFIAMQFRAQLFDIEETQTVEITPSGFQTYVETCLGEVSREGVFLLGDQGGYAQIPETILNDQRSYFGLGDGFFRVPLWYYKGESRMPSIGSMEESLSYFVQENVEECFSGFDPFKKTFAVDVKSRPAVETTIGDNDIVVSLDYEVELTSLAANKTTEYRRFAISVPVRLRRLYNLAQDIMEAENRDFLFEKATIDFMSLHPDIPFSSMEFTCRPRRWLVEDVEQDIKDLLFYNLFKTRFRNTDYPPFMEEERVYREFEGYDARDVLDESIPEEGAPADAYEYFHLLFDVTNEDYSDIRAGVEFLPQTDFDMVVKPSRNGVMDSQSSKGASKYLSYLCMQFYHFTYDLRYLLRVNLHDDSSLNGEGFDFSFAFPVLIKSNRPDRREPSITLFEDPVTYTNPCTELSGDMVSIKALGLFQGYDGFDLEGVNISYDCIKEGCYLGKTYSHQGSYQLMTRMPDLCTGGFITASKEGYQTANKQYTGQEQFTIKLKKTQDFNVRVKKKRLDSPGQEFELGETETAYVSISSPDGDVNIYEEFNSGDVKKMNLLAEDGDYKLDFILMTSVYDQLLGGYKGNWTYDYEEVAGHDEITFYVLEYVPSPLTIEDQYEMMDFLETDDSYREKLEPTFT